MKEQRKHPRFAIEVDAEITVGDLTVTGRTHDISRGGFCLTVHRQVPVHVECEVRLSLVFSENEFSEPMALAAATVWCTPLQQAYQLGIKFGELNPQSRGYLDLFIRFLDGEDDGEEVME